MLDNIQAFLKVLTAFNQEGPTTEQQRRPLDQDGGFFFCLNAGKYFDVEYEDIRERIKSALILTPPFHQIIGDRPDLYGPFWIATTLIAIIIASSSLMVFLSEGNKTYNFNQISVAGILVNQSINEIYGISFVTPYVIAVLVRMFGGKMPVVRLICIYGYSMTAFIPSTCLCFIESVLFQTIVLGISFVISVIFLIRSVMNIEHELQERQRFVICSVLVSVQLILILTYKFYFFNFSDTA